MNTSLDSARAAVAVRPPAVQETHAPAVARAPAHVVTGRDDASPEGFGLRGLSDVVQRFAARGAQSMSAMQSAVRASLAAAPGESTLARLSAIATLSLAALGFQAHAAAPLPTTAGVGASNVKGNATGGVGVAAIFASALDAAQRRPDVLGHVIDALQARRGADINNKVRSAPADAVEVALAGARAAVAGGQIDSARAHIAAARTAMAAHPTPKQREAEALDGALAARLTAQLVNIVGPEGQRVVGGAPGELLKAFMAALFSKDVVLAAAIEPVLTANLAQAPAAATREAAPVHTDDALLMTSAALMLLGGVGMMVAGRRKNAAETAAPTPRATRD